MSTDLRLSMQTDVALRAIIEFTILDHPRSKQTHIGGSEVGTECTRKLAHKLAGTPAARIPTPGWRPTVGTATHSWLEKAMHGENTRLGWDRWLIETRLHVGQINGVEVPSTSDVFDRLTGTVIDWKVPGVTTIRKARSNGHPGQQYRVQVHGYGKGYKALGYLVNTVAIYYLPAAGELSDGYYWSEPFDESIADVALARATALVVASATLGWDGLIPQLSTAADFCQSCDWFQPHASDLRIACPGHPEAVPTATQIGSVFKSRAS